MRPGLRLSVLFLVASPLASPATDDPIIRLGSDHFRQRQHVDAITYSADGKLLATVDGSSVHIWDAADGRRLHAVPIGNHSFYALRFTLDGHRLLAAGITIGGGTSLCRIDPATGKLLDSKHVDSVPISGSFSPDAAFLAIRNKSEDLLQIVDTATRQVVVKDQLHGQESIGAYAWRPDSKVLASVTVSGRVRLYECKSGKTLHEYQVAGETVGMAFSPKGDELIASIDVKAGYQIVRMDATTGKAKWKQAIYRADEILFGPDGKNIIYLGCTDNREAHRWHWLDAGTGKPLGHIMDPGYGVAAMRFDSKVMAVGTYHGLITQWDLTTRKRLNASADPPHQVTQLSFSPDGAKVRGWAQGWYEWDVITGKQTWLTPKLDFGANELVFVSQDFRWLGKTVWGPAPIGVDRPGEFTLTDLSTGKESFRRVLHGNNAQFQLFPNGHLLTVEPTAISVMDPTTSKTLRQIDRGAAHSVRVTENGMFAVFVRRVDDGVRVSSWDLSSGKRLAEWSGFVSFPGELFDAWVREGGLSPDGRMLLIQFARTVRQTSETSVRDGLFDARTGRKICEWRRAPSKEPRFSQDGRMVALFGNDPGGMELREVATGERRIELGGHRRLESVAFAPDGTTVAVAISPGPVEIWDVSGGPPTGGWKWTPALAERFWDILQQPTGEEPFQVICAMRKAPTEAIARLKDRVKVPIAPKREWLAARIKDLDAPVFRDRERATTELAQLGELAESPMREAIAGASPEARERLKGLLAKLDKTTPEQLRSIRACEILEGIGNAEARALLTDWAKGPAGATLCREATESLERLKKARK